MARGSRAGCGALRPRLDAIALPGVDLEDLEGAGLLPLAVGGCVVSLFASPWGSVALAAVAGAPRANRRLEGGADIRHIQEILGHVETSTAAIYTRVSIRHLKQVHDATHPGAKSAKRANGATAAASARAAPHELARGVPSEDELFSSLAAEDDAGDEGKELAS